MSARSIIKRLLPDTAKRTMRRWLDVRRRSRYQPRVVRRRYGQNFFNIELVDQKGAHWYDRDHELDPEIVMLTERGLRPGARVFDLGAHQGVVALALAQRVGPTGHVVAVEANPFDASAAERNRQLNDMRQLDVLNVAVGDRAGTIAFSRGRVGTGDASQPSQIVPVRTVDDLAAEYGKPDVLFIDVDGYEAHALRGAKQVLNSRPDCYIEVHSTLLPQYGVSAHDIIAFFPSGDYQLLVSSEMRTSRRRFTPLMDDFDVTRGFHMLALGRE